MKIIVFSVCVLVMVVSSDGLSTNRMMKVLLQCKKDTNCQENLLEEMTMRVIPQTKEGLNALHCTGHRIGLITVHNKINVKVLKEILEKLEIDRTKAESIANTCHTKYAGADNTVAMKSFLTCIKAEAGVVIL